MMRLKHAAGRWKPNTADNRKVVSSNAIYLLKAGECEISIIEGVRLRTLLFENPRGNLTFARINTNV